MVNQRAFSGVSERTMRYATQACHRLTAIHRTSPEMAEEMLDGLNALFTAQHKERFVRELARLDRHHAHVTETGPDAEELSELIREFWSCVKSSFMYAGFDMIPKDGRLPTDAAEFMQMADDYIIQSDLETLYTITGLYSHLSELCQQRFGSPEQCMRGL